MVADIDRLRQYMRESVKAEEDLVKVLQSAKNRPSPIDGYFGAVYYIGPIFTAFRGTMDESRTRFDEAAPMIWRGPMASSAVRQMANDVAWGSAAEPLDVLVRESLRRLVR